MAAPEFHLFERFGVELEYMIVDRRTLDVRPVADELIRAVAGAYQSDVEVDDLCWSNELVLHVVELKTGEPAPALGGLAERFQRHVRRIDELLAPHGARLLPTAMHPWMDPDREMRLWPHEYSAVYEAFNRIFNCRGHGWSNLQCTHLNLPFADDDEFGRLHAAIRLLLPILPALAASSPIVSGRLSGLLDTRLEVYRTNARRVPSVTGSVIPEPVFSIRDYQEQILKPMYADIAPLDPDGVLQDEWLNARGAIARFCRNTIEIRVLDIQECPQADLAVLALVVAALRFLVEERAVPYRKQRGWKVAPLEDIFMATLAAGGGAVIASEAYRRAFGLSGRRPCTAGELWRHVYEAALPKNERPEHQAALRVILERGPLARRIRDAVGANPTREQLRTVYGELADCLAYGRMFTPDGGQREPRS